MEEKDFFFGAHVCRAARIKAVTPAGHAYASEQFVAALAVVDGDNNKRFFYEYLGHRDLAKSYDRCALYRLCRMDHVRKHALVRTNIVQPLTSPTTGTNLSAAELLLKEGEEGAEGAADAAGAGGAEGEEKDAEASGDNASATGAVASPRSPLGASELASPSAQRRASSSSSASSSSFDPSLLHPSGGPLSALTIERASPLLVSRLVAHYLSLESGSGSGSGSGPGGPDGSTCWDDVGLLHALVARLIALGQTHAAFLVVQKGLADDSAFKHDLRLKYFRVLALRHTQKADDFMKELRETIAAAASPSSIPADLRASVLALSGRMLKDKFFDSVRNHDPQISLAHDSAREYFLSHQLQHSSFPAINAATMLLLSKQKERARALAKFSVKLVADELLARSRQPWGASSTGSGSGSGSGGGGGSSALATTALELANGLGDAGAGVNNLGSPFSPRSGSRSSSRSSGSSYSGPPSSAIASAAASAAQRMFAEGDAKERAALQAAEKASSGDGKAKEVGEEYCELTHNAATHNRLRCEVSPF